MQDLLVRRWPAAPATTQHHPGCLAWRAKHIRGRERQWKRQLWWSRDTVVGFGWLTLPGTLSWELHPDHPELLEDVLRWFESNAETNELETTALSNDAATLELLRQCGYRERIEPAWVSYLRRDLADLPVGPVLSDYETRPVQEGEVDARVAVHRKAWPGTRVDADSYRDLQASWPYRRDLDLVAVAATGEFVAYALCWYDEANGVGEFQPVGTAASHQRKGLAYAVGAAALRKLREIGAHEAVVECRGDPGYPIPKLLYEKLGFSEWARTTTVRKSLMR